MKRRELLRGGLTLAGLGLLGCRPGQEQAAPLLGERRDPSHQAGHRLLRGALPSRPSRTERCDGVVLGGGVAGLSAGWRWTRAGFEDYTLLELEPETGGNSRALSYPPTAAPIGAHYLPLPNLEAKAVRRLLTEMGVLGDDGIDSRHLCHSRQERIFYRGAWYDGLVPEDALEASTLAQFETFTKHVESWASRRDAQGRKVFALPLELSSREPRYLALDRLSFADYARGQGWDDPFLLWYLEYACRDDFGGSLDNCSAWAGLHYFASRDGGGLGDPDRVLVWPEGNNRLVRFLREQQGGRVETGALVLKVANAGSGGVEVDYLDLATQERVRIACRVAVFCLPAFVRRHLLAGGPDTSTFVYPPWVTANLLLDRTPRDLDPPGHVAWDNVIQESPSLGYVVATHQHLATDPLRETVWTWYRPFPHDPVAKKRRELLDSTWEGWAETVLADLANVHPDIRQRCRRLDVTVLGHGMIRPSPNFIWSENLAAARRPQGRVFFGHGDLSGMSLFEESQYRGVLAAEEALAAIGIRPPSFL